MSPGPRRLFRLRGLRRKDSVREVDDEMRLHIELRAAELERSGMDPDRAGAEAERMFAADPDTLRRLYASAVGRDRRARVRGRLESLRQDARYASRGLARDPMLTAFIVVALGLGIGATATSWSLVDRLLVRPPAHVVDPDRVARLYAELEESAIGSFTTALIPYSAYRQFRELEAFESAGAYRIFDRAVGTGAEARRLRVGTALGDFFPMLGVRPVVGRLFDEGADAAVDGEMAILGYDLWNTRFDRDPDVVGRTIRIHDVPHAIVGVLPSGFSGVEPRRVDVWKAASSADRGNVNWSVVGRLRPGVAAQTAAAEATALHQADEGGSFAWFRDPRIFTAPLGWDSDGREPVEATLARWLAAVTAIILFITFANVVNLLLVRLSRRRRELAVRVALGSGRGRVIRLIVAEGALLALAGGAASLLVTRLLEPLVRNALMAEAASWTFSIGDGRLLLLVSGIVFLTILCVATLPAWQAGSPDVVRDLRGGARAGTSTLRLRSGLTVAQAALSVLLLVGAGLFLRSFANVRAVDLGIDREEVLTVEALLPPVPELAAAPGGYLAAEREIYRRLEDEVRRLPGVSRAAIAIGLPLDGGAFSTTAWVPGMDSLPSLPGGGPWVSTVTAGYFEAIGTEILRGRAFTEADREGSEPVVIVNETMARTLWNGEDALGRCMRVGSRDNPCARVVGVAEDVHRTGLRTEPSFQYYIPLGQQNMFGGAHLVVRPTAGRPIAPVALRQAVVDADPRVWGAEIRSLDASLEGELRPLRLGMVTFGISGALALLVAVLGLYSLMSYMVAGRRHEIGVRIALGADRGNVIGLVVRSGLLLAAAGVAVGLGLALVSGRWLEPHLFETSGRDGVVMAGVAIALLATSVVAGWIPARRAARISPTEALRTE